MVYNSEAFARLLRNAVQDTLMM